MTFLTNVKAALLRNLAVAIGWLLVLMALEFTHVHLRCDVGSTQLVCSNWLDVLVFFVLPLPGFFLANLPAYRQDQKLRRYVYPAGWALYAYLVLFVPAYLFIIWFHFLIGGTK